MTTALCITCGAPLSGPFCTQCGTAAPKPLFVDETVPPSPSDDVEATVVRTAPLVPPSVAFPPPPKAPEPTVGIPPLYAAPLAPPPIQSHPRDRRKLMLASGAVVALIAGAATVGYVALRGGSSTTSTPAAATTTAMTSRPPMISPDPAGTRSSRVPAWANRNIGHVVNPHLVLGGEGKPMGFRTEGGNHCAATGADAVCMAADTWTRSHALPTGPDCIGTQVTHPVSLFWLRAGQLGEGLRCTTMPPALALPLPVAPANQVVALGASGVLCLIDRAPRQSTRTGVACWNPQTNHGFMITSQDKAFW